MKTLNSNHPIIRWLLAALVILPLAACTGPQTPSLPVETPAPVQPTGAPQIPPTEAQPAPPDEAQSGQFQLIQAEIPRNTAPVTDDVAEAVAGNTAFAFDLYQALREQPGNLFYSPHSISLALAMTYAGAAGETEQQMANTLHFTLAQDQLHPAFNALDLSLMSANEAAPAEGDEEAPQPFQLRIANSLWGQQDYEFLPEFTALLAENYGAGLRLVDFAQATEAARQAINGWVSDQTEGRIQDLIPQGVLTTWTRLVLANAIYFKADWRMPFEEDATHDGEFTLLDGSQKTVKMMSQMESLRYAEGYGYQAVELPYVGDRMTMIAILPAPGTFAEFEATLDAAKLDEVVKGLQPQEVDLTLPKFQFESSFALSDALKALGMPVAFDPDNADFSGMNGKPELFISEVLHKAFVAVDEQGTEAAAATAVIMDLAMAMQPDVTLTLDHPFIFLIRDNETGAVLFAGRLVEP